MRSRRDERPDDPPDRRGASGTARTSSAHFGHIKALGYKPKDALDQLVREIAFTHLNRLCAYKMMEAREVYVGGQKFREAVSRGMKSQGFQFYLADHPEDERAASTPAIRTWPIGISWTGWGHCSPRRSASCSRPPTRPIGSIPPQRVLDDVLALLNSDGPRRSIWSEDETIGWVYQYFTPKELRDQARKESQAPRNSYELAFRNQFFTPRYVVEFLTDNTLGRIWYEMRKGDTKLKDQCRYMVRRPDEVFLADPSTRPRPATRRASRPAEAVDSGADYRGDDSPPIRAGGDEMGSVDRLTGDRLLRVAHAVRSVRGRASRVPERMRRLEEWPEGQASDPVRRTQDLWDVLFTRCNGLSAFGGSGRLGEDLAVRARCANEMRRRLLVATEVRTLTAGGTAALSRSTSPTVPRKTPARSRSSTRPAAAATSCSTASTCC